RGKLRPTKVQKNMYEQDDSTMRMRARSDGDCHLDGSAQAHGASCRGGRHAAILSGRQTGTTGGLPEMGVLVVGLRDELLADGERPFDIYKRFRNPFFVRLLRSAQNLAGQDDVCAGSLRFSVEGFDQRARKLPERIDGPGRGSERREKVCRQV